MLSFFPRGVLDEILNLIESVSEGFPFSCCFPQHTFISFEKVRMEARKINSNQAERKDRLIPIPASNSDYKTYTLNDFENAKNKIHKIVFSHHFSLELAKQNHLVLNFILKY